MSREGKLLKNTLVLSIGTVFPKIINFITLPILTAYLTKSEYGQYDLITVLCSLFLPAVTLRIETAAFRFLIDEKDDKREKSRTISSIFSFIIPISIISLILLLFFLPGFSTLDRVFIAMYFFFEILYTALGQIARGLSKNRIYAEASVISALSNLAFVVLLVYYFNKGLSGVLLTMIVSITIPFLILCARLNITEYLSLKYVDRNKIKKLISYSWPMVPNSMSMWVMNASDRIVISLALGVETNAVYAVAKKIPNILTILQGTFTMAWQENASIVSKDADSDTYYSSMFSIMFNLMAGFMGVLIATTPLLFVVLIRGDYSEAYNQIPILFLSMFFYSMCSFLGGIYVAYKNTKSVGITTTLAAVCNLVVNIATIKYIGLFAASISTLVSYFLLFIFRAVNVKKMVAITYNFKQIMTVLFVLGIESILCFLHTPITNVVNFIFGVVFFVVLNNTFVKMLLNKGLSMMRNFRK